MLENKVAELEEHFSRAILQQQLLKSENALLQKELSRLKKQINQNSHPYQTGQIIDSRKAKIKAKYSKLFTLTDNKIQNCQKTIVKYQQLLKKLERQDQDLRAPKKSLSKSRYSSSSKKAYGQFVESQKSRMERNVYSEIKCEDCGVIFKPNRYFQHLQQKNCFQKSENVGSERKKNGQEC